MSDTDVRIKLNLDGVDSVKAGLTGVGDAASESDGKLASLAAGGLKAVGAGMVALGAAAVGATTYLVKSVTEQYGAYEQNVGGISKLFGDGTEELTAAAQQMVDYSAEAFRTAGVSANQYMETVTSFSAALISGLGGDTVAAADIANMAMVDMSDNANTFGTAIENIQSAYQGFAKQNYTMLDNLKLGYGGTATEMARLINDSGVLGDTVQITADEVNDVSFDTIIQAIHVIQDRMNIAGTTSREAAKTIQGSFGMLSGAWTNLMTGIGDSSADIPKLVGDVMDSLQSVINNMGPLLERIASNMDGLGPLISSALDALIPAIVQFLPALLEAGTSLIVSLLQGIISAAPQLISSILPLLNNFVTSVLGMLPMLATAGMQIIVQLVNGITQNIPTIIPVAIASVLALVQGILDNLPLLMDAALQLILALATGLIDALPTLIEALPQIITAVVDFFIQSIPAIIDAGIQLLTALVENLPAIISAIVAAIPQIIIGIVNAVRGNHSNISSSGQGLFEALITNLPAIIATLVTGAGKMILSLIQAIGGKAGEFAQVGLNLMSSLGDGIAGAVGNLIGKAKQVASNVIGAVKSAFGIGSPSKVFKYEIGAMLPEGLGLGVEDNTDAAIKPLQTMTSKLIAAVQLPVLTIPQTVGDSMTSATSAMLTSTPVSTPSTSTTIAAAISAQPVTATISPDDMNLLALKVNQAMIAIRRGDSQDAVLSAMKGIR